MLPQEPRRDIESMSLLVRRLMARQTGQPAIQSDTTKRAWIDFMFLDKETQ